MEIGNLTYVFSNQFFPVIFYYAHRYKRKLILVSESFLWDFLWSGHFHKADTFIKRKLFYGPNGVCFREIPMYQSIVPGLSDANKKIISLLHIDLNVCYCRYWPKLCRPKLPSRKTFRWANFSSLRQKFVTLARRNI